MTSGVGGDVRSDRASRWAATRASALSWLALRVAGEPREDRLDGGAVGRQEPHREPATTGTHLDRHVDRAGGTFGELTRERGATVDSVRIFPSVLGGGRDRALELAHRPAALDGTSR